MTNSDQDHKRYRKEDIRTLSGVELIHCWHFGFEVAEFPTDIAEEEIKRRLANENDITIEALLWYIQMFTWYPDVCKKFKPMPNRCSPISGLGTEEDWLKEIVDTFKEEKQKVIDGFETDKIKADNRQKENKMLDSQTATDCAKEEPLSVEKGVNFIADQVGRVESSIQTLENRLSLVLREASPKMEKDSTKQMEPCKLADKLVNIGERLLEASQNIESISNRLEI